MKYFVLLVLPYQLICLSEVDFLPVQVFLYLTVAFQQLLLVYIKGVDFMWEHLVLERLPGIDLLLEERQSRLECLKRLPFQVNALSNLLVFVIICKYKL